MESLPTSPFFSLTHLKPRFPYVENNTINQSIQIRRIANLILFFICSIISILLSFELINTTHINFKLPRDELSEIQ